MSPFSRVRLVLALGAGLGFALALTAIVEKRTSSVLPKDAVALVNGTPIRSADYERALRSLASDRRDLPGEAEQRAVLDRLIDEELLVQRAKELGVLEQDRVIRGRLVSSMMATILADSAATEPGAEEVAAFYRENTNLFTPVQRVWVRDFRVGITEARPEEEARKTAERAAARLRAGDDFAAVASELGDPPVAPPPAGLIPATKLREYLGPSAVRIALGLSAGGVSDPVVGAAAFHVLQLVERETGAVPPLETIEKDVRAEMRRGRDERALKATLDHLRERAKIQVRER